MLYGHRETKYCSYSWLLTREAVGAGVTLNAAIMLVHHSNSCLEGKHREKKKNQNKTQLYETELFFNWVEGFFFSPGISFWFSGSQKNSRIPIFFSYAPTHEKPLVRLSHELLWFGSMAFMCVFFFPQSHTNHPLINRFVLIFSDCRYRNLPSGIREPNPSSLGETNILEKILKVTLSIFTFFLIKEVIEEVLRIPSFDTEDVNVRR